jgi:hypothetical protein
MERWEVVFVDGDQIGLSERLFGHTFGEVKATATV